MSNINKHLTHLCNTCTFAVHDSCTANVVKDCILVRTMNDFAENIVSCAKYEEDATFKDVSNIRTIKEINILIDQMMEDAGLENTLEKVGYLQALQHDYLQDLRGEND